jgi:hypothetical protein
MNTQGDQPYSFTLRTTEHAEEYNANLTDLLVHEQYDVYDDYDLDGEPLHDFDTPDSQ